jgi:aminopeptidase N
MAMHHYVTSHAYQTVVTSDLEKAFEEVTKQNLKQFFNQWVYGAGFPVFQVSYSYNSTTRQITLHAREVQPRDSLTGYFDADVDVEVLTEHSAVHGVMPVRGEIGEMTLQLDGPPRSIHWNKGQWLLEQHDFPRPTRMIICQLLNDDDILGRLEALTLLRTRGPSPVIQAAIAQAARFDKAVDVRTAALTELAALHPDTTFQRTIVQDVLHDPDPRVRIRLLKMFPRGATATELAAIVQHDSSFVVRGEALAAYLTVAGEAGLPFVEQVMAAPSWPRALCKSALLVLAMMPGPKAQALHQRYAR